MQNLKLLCSHGKPLREDGSFEGQEAGKRSALEAQQHLIICLCDGGGEVLLLNIIFAKPPSSSWCTAPYKLHFQALCLSGTWGPLSTLSFTSQVHAVCLPILPCPRPLDASPGSWHQEEFFLGFRGTKNMPLIEVDTVGLTSSIGF